VLLLHCQISHQLLESKLHLQVVLFIDLMLPINIPVVQLSHQIVLLLLQLLDYFQILQGQSIHQTNLATMFVVVGPSVTTRILVEFTILRTSESATVADLLQTYFESVVTQAQILCLFVIVETLCSELLQKQA